MMKHYLLILTYLVFFVSCKNSPKEKIENNLGNSVVTENLESHIKPDPIVDIKQQEVINCDKYWEIRFPNDTVKVNYINKIISETHLTDNNTRFLNALKYEKENALAYEKVLSPIFRLSNSEIGIFTFPKLNLVNNRLISVSKEADLIERHDTITENTMEHFGKVKFYPILLDSLTKSNLVPKIYYYTTNKIDSTKIMQLGTYVDECLEYYEYSIDTTYISINDKVLFSSPYQIDLIFEGNKRIDSLIKLDYKQECNDCPNSMALQRTFARIKGTDNLYFIYADTFPINNELDTPSRALILVNQKNEIIYLWSDAIDLFGCSCL